MLFLVTTVSESIVKQKSVDILDTEDLVVETIEKDRLVELLQSGVVELYNARLIGDLLVTNHDWNWFYLLDDYSLSLYNGKIVYERAAENYEIVTIAGKRHILELKTIIDEGSACTRAYFTVNWAHRTEGFDLHTLIGRRGVSHIYRLKEYIVVLFIFDVPNLKYFIYVIFNMDGDLVGIVPDVNLHCPAYVNLDGVFISRFVTLGKNVGCF